MAKLTRARAEERADALQAEFDAWQEHAEDLGPDALALRRLIGRARALLRRVHRLDDPAGRALTERLNDQLGAFRGAWSALERSGNGANAAELDSLTQALLRGEPEAGDALAERLVVSEAETTSADIETLGLRASFLFARYARHFAGKPRASRDALMLGDMERYLSSMVERLVLELTLHLQDALMKRIELLTEQLAIWALEQEQIGPAREALPPRERLHALAELTDGLAAEWRVQVAQVPGSTVRPRLVKRLLKALELVRIDVDALAATELPDDLEARELLARVVELQDAWLTRKDELAAQRRRSSPMVRARALQAEVAECILQWAREITGGAHGPDRVTRMGELCDRLQELERQLAKAVHDGANDTTERLLGYARARLVEWELAWEQAYGG
ncbi:MAG: hypothetical protein EP329_26935 [Deltaproteobacteria bacterium]|nr:MAG: hypothetical protein EP329_26935 [Deltaproteobacteria bacterium]